MRRTWIKLYVELLDDPKLALVPDLVRLRFIQLLLVAGADDQDGLLPDSKRLAWRLRVEHNQLLNELRALKNAGVICREGESWIVTNFAKRQAAMTSYERVQSFRRRKNDEAHRYLDDNENDEAAAEEGVTSASSSTSPSLSSSQGEEVQEEGDTTSPAAAQPPETDPNPKASRKRHKSAFARSENDLNAGTRAAERLLLQVAGMAALPPGEVPRVEQVAALAARYGPGAAAKELADQRQRWLKTVSEKTGKLYSPLNFSWVDWADAALGGHPIPESPAPPEESAAFDREAYDELERKAVPPSPEIQAEIDRILGRQSHAQVQP